jgi:hypothetical protein
METPTNSGTTTPEGAPELEPMMKDSILQESTTSKVESISKGDDFIVLNTQDETPTTAMISTTTTTKTALAESLERRLADRLRANEALKEQLAETQRIQDLHSKLESAEQEAESMQQQISNLQKYHSSSLQQKQQQPGDEEEDKPSSKPATNNINNKNLGTIGRYDSFLQAYATLQDGEDPRKAPFHAADLLQLTMKDHGTRAHGIFFLELWIVKDARLFRPNHGWWMDHDINVSSTNEAKDLAFPCNLCRLAVPERPDYVPATEQLFGEGLPGVLWSEAQGEDSSERRVLW